jgi:hypothetical protein
MRLKRRPIKASFLKLMSFARDHDVVSVADVMRALCIVKHGFLTETIIASF